MARKIYSCDFETTTKIDDCRVWAYGYMEVYNRKNYKIGNSMDEFMKWLIHCQSDVYFHNLKFDGSFIINYLLSRNFEFSRDGEPNTFNAIISNMGQWYMIDICLGYKGKRKIHTVIYDSIKKLPFPVKKIAKDFQLELRKGEIDYHLERPPGWQITDEEYLYIKNDIEIIAQALEIQFKQGLKKMTNGSDSLSGFKDTISTKMFEKLFPVFDVMQDKEFRPYYKGGYTWLNKIYANKTIKEGIVLDVNSLYPSQMYERPLPVGHPIKFNGKYEYDESYPLYLQHLRCEFKLKENKIPMIQVKKQRLRFMENEYLEESDGSPVDLYLTNVDLELFLDHYEIMSLDGIEYVGGYKFRARTGVFKKFIDKWTYIKINFEGAIQLLAKLMLNSLYGKFASNPNVTGKIPYMKDNGALGFRMDDETYKDPVYTPMGCFITAWARYVTITTAQKCYDRIIYCDTDSLHLTGLEIPDVIKDIVHPKKLGMWAHELTFKMGKYLRQKTYIHEVYVKEVEKDGEKKLKNCLKHEATTTKVVVKCSGMTDKIKEKVNFGNFKVGFSSYGKNVPKQVRGGVVLVDSEFSIR